MIRVFISYSHDNDIHKKRVHELADRLKRDGVSIVFDRDCGPGGPDDGWDKWSEIQAEKADIVLPVFTPEYKKCWDGEQIPGMRLGAIHELKVLYRRLHNAGNKIEFCRILTFEDAHRNNIPLFLEGLPSFDALKDYEQLIAWLREKGAAPDRSQAPPVINWPAQPSDYPWPLADRKTQFKTFQALLSDTCSQRIFLIEGVSNTGKTVLLNEFRTYTRSIALNAILLDLKGCPTLNDLLDLIALELDKSILPEFHSSSDSRRKTALLKDLENLSTPLLLIFDTYQHVGNDTADWVEGQLLRRSGQCSALRILIAGQRVPDRERYPWKILAQHCTLDAIRETRYWLEYVQCVLNSHQITEDHLEMLLHVSKGDPGQTSALLQSFAVSKPGDE